MANVVVAMYRLGRYNKPLLHENAISFVFTYVIYQIHEPFWWRKAPLPTHTILGARPLVPYSVRNTRVSNVVVIAAVYIYRSYYACKIVQIDGHQVETD